MKKQKKRRIKKGIRLQAVLFLIFIVPMILFGKVENRNNDGEVVYDTSQSIYEMLLQ